jgi:hypothetical protein
MNDQRAEALRNVFERLGYWSVQIAKDGEDANLAPPTELVDAINRLARASAAPQEPVVKEWRDLGKEHFDKLRREANYAAQCHDAAMKLFTEASAIHGDDLADPRTVENLRDVLAAAPQPQAPSSDDVRDSLDGQELRRAVAQIGVVGQIDGHDVVRRLSVLDIIDRRVK